MSASKLSDHAEALYEHARLIFSSHPPDPDSTLFLGLVYQSPDDDGDRDGSFSHLVFQISFAVRDKVPPEFLLGDVGKEWSVEYQVI